MDEEKRDCMQKLETVKGKRKARAQGQAGSKARAENGKTPSNMTSFPRTALKATPFTAATASTTTPVTTATTFFNASITITTRIKKKDALLNSMIKPF